MSYSLRNENKHVIIFRYISIIDNRDEKETFTIAFINRIMVTFKMGVLFLGPPLYRVFQKNATQL